MDKRVLNELKELYRDGFPEDNDGDVAAFFARVKPDCAAYVERDGRIVSAGYIMDKPAKLFGQVTKLPYLSALSTRTGCRGKGEIRAVIAMLFNRLYRRGDFVCALYPFSYGYYTRFGFCDISFCGERADGEPNVVPNTADFDNFFLAPTQSYPEIDFAKNTRPYLQGRIIHAKSALKAAKYRLDCPKNLVLQIIDPMITENNITVRLAVDGGAAIVTETAESGQSVGIADLCNRIFSGDGGIFALQRNLFIDRY
jgi:predicted acetyltransferase